MADNRLAARADAFVKRLQNEDVNMHGFILSVNGQEKAKAYYAPFKEGTIISWTIFRIGCLKALTESCCG